MNVEAWVDLSNAHSICSFHWKCYDNGLIFNSRIENAQQYSLKSQSGSDKVAMYIIFIVMWSQLSTTRIEKEEEEEKGDDKRVVSRQEIKILLKKIRTGWKMKTPMKMHLQRIFSISFSLSTSFACEVSTLSSFLHNNKRK